MQLRVKCNNIGAMIAQIKLYIKTSDTMTLDSRQAERIIMHEGQHIWA